MMNIEENAVISPEVIEAEGDVPERVTGQPSLLDIRAGRFGRQAKGFAVWTAILSVCFVKPLYDLARHSLHSELYSYIPMVPLISLYLVWLKRRELRLDSAPS